MTHNFDVAKQSFERYVASRRWPEARRALANMQREVDLTPDLDSRAELRREAVAAATLLGVPVGRTKRTVKCAGCGRSFSTSAKTKRCSFCRARSAPSTSVRTVSGGLPGQGKRR